MKITKDNYFKDHTYLNYHTLKDFQKCEYLYSQRRAGNVKEIDRPCFLYGHVFENELVGVIDDNIRVGYGRSKAEKMLKDEGVKFVTPTFINKIRESVQEMNRQPLFEKLNTGEDQVILTGVMEGIKCKGMFDKIHVGDHVVRITDWKTTANILKFGPEIYTGQLSFYSMLAELKYPGRKYECYLSVADKSDYNKHAAFYLLSQDNMYQGRQALKETMLLIKEAEKVGIFDPTTNKEECWTCDHYNDCPYSKQNKFIIF